MLKKIVILIIGFVIVLGVAVNNKAPVFYGYSNRFEVCLDKASSSTEIIRVSDKEFYIFEKVGGECFSTDYEEFNLDNFLRKYNAQIVMVEQLEQGISYYAYSPTLKYKALILGKTVNLQIFIGDRVTVGSPFIFGSF